MTNTTEPSGVPGVLPQEDFLNSLLPVVVLIGRPNVGKSTMFNRLTRSRDALVADLPGLTRDRQYGRGRMGPVPYLIVDTGGFEPDSRTGISSHMAKQTRQALVEADYIIFVVDGRDGLVPHDLDIGMELRRHTDKVTVVVNKTEGMARTTVSAEFFQLGLGEPVAVSSAHGDGVAEMIDQVLESEAKAVQEEAARLAAEQTDEQAPAPAFDPDNPTSTPVEDWRIRIAVIGRPNVGKSTLINTLLGEERVVAFDQPGTTRDSISIDFERAGQRYTLIDTAGVRRRARVSEAIEKFSVIKTLQAIEACNVCVLLLDAGESISDQDAHLAGHIMEAGRALVVAVNKWDLPDSDQRRWLKVEVERKFHFLSFARFHFVSALKAQGIGSLLKSVDRAYMAAMAKLSTPKITRVLHDAVTRQEPPRKGPIRPKLRYAHQGGQNPPIIIVHGNALNHVSASYTRYLEGVFRREFKLDGTPLRVEYRTSANPYEKPQRKGRQVKKVKRPG